ncbi:MAG: protein-methionine-sulfoxide reductase catalytic subunit MsrP [Methylovulum sp.]|jgi:sulfoxide reductase catalytic subunit YedY|nr:protein-methionine-sulfoxide reductase catalytic subunit MsrP [Methylovulum sp.]MCF7997591.1 protein-methionine-sulfoxide reductase catalytic subunit MsrP [Methylovulum sp.]
MANNKIKYSIPSYEITDISTFKNRRNIIKAAFASGLLGSGIRLHADDNKPKWSGLSKSHLSIDTPNTPKEIIENYTNYYEFSFNKNDSTVLSQRLTVDPWTIEISGEVEKPGKFNLEDLLRQNTLEERIYRFRCVEAWSMVVPWVGFSLGDLLKKVQPLSTAQFVKFTSIYQPEIMPNQKSNSMLQWPYEEALRIDEAMHPLTLLAVGMYGDTLPKQNGAPLRLIVPWKYGFKNIKAIVKIELLKRAPNTSWNLFAPDEYGFYANVNPDLPHPRWSQNTERLLGGGFFTPRRKTELFNGYAEHVAYLYKDMDLRHFF